MYIEELCTRPQQKSITVTFNYDEIRDIANGLYYLTKQSDQHDNTDYKNIYAKCKFLFDMIKHGNIQPETVEKLNRSKLTNDEIDTFNTYLEQNDIKTAFGNTDWNHIYHKIVGDRISESLARIEDAANIET